jgi:hypothetical protein
MSRELLGPQTTFVSAQQRHAVCDRGARPARRTAGAARAGHRPLREDHGPAPGVPQPLGVGTIDAPEWRIDDRRRAYVTRAVAARAGLYGNHGDAIVHVDADGEQLNGAHRYELRLEALPPVDAF